MKVCSFLIISLIVMITFQANADFSDWGKVDPNCTISCGWYCIAREGSGCLLVLYCPSRIWMRFSTSMQLSSICWKEIKF
uniref:Uncharacterized protein n=1 Tax=Acrobeloides nanus TaxID=290746 RepID=A0A914CG70_9BILA